MIRRIRVEERNGHDVRACTQDRIGRSDPCMHRARTPCPIEDDDTTSSLAAVFPLLLATTAVSCSTEAAVPSITSPCCPVISRPPCTLLPSRQLQIILPLRSAQLALTYGVPPMIAERGSPIVQSNRAAVPLSLRCFDLLKG